MHSTLLIIFFVSGILIVHTYVIYPLSMILFFSKTKKKIVEYSIEDELPNVLVLIAAYNEEKVIGEKIDSVFNSTYPLKKIKVYVGSDASQDNTDNIVENLKQNYPNLELVKFSGRVGKISIINQLQSLEDAEILIMTDANVIFKPTTIFELVKKFKDERVGIVAANIFKESINDEGIAIQEKKYLSMENKIKTCESNAFNLIMGAEGGCYAIRDNLFTQVPLRFIVDDFYITMQVLNRGKFTLFNPDAICIEDLPSDTAGEYKRKVRISSGNFQNLFFFKKLLFAIGKPVSYAFWSHKVLRWLTPFFLFMSLSVSAALIYWHPIFIPLFFLQLFGFSFPVLDHLFKFKNSGLKFISHFYMMNLALLEGFVKFTKGIKTSVWQPIKRNV
ncbi:glycosyltransferase [Aurantibacillus circumpalustris]|uniref:glycosyltransferase n=1 Tax=Aurantibacillus circumpalustris TaxID=3036359 RepID=UPI00295B3EC6|nr:glycosyltransferase [Aurantibacillus circumpalustris]